MSNSFRIGPLVTEILQSGPLRVLNGMAMSARQYDYVVGMVTFDPEDGQPVAQAIGCDILSAASTCPAR